MRLLSLSTAEIETLINKLESEAKKLKEEALRIAWSMRGGLSYSEIMMLSTQERELIGKITKENIEITKKTKLPYF